MYFVRYKSQYTLNGWLDVGGYVHVRIYRLRAAHTHSTNSTMFDVCMYIFRFNNSIAYALTDLDRNEEPFICSFHHLWLFTTISSYERISMRVSQRASSKRVEHTNRKQQNGQNGELLPQLTFKFKYTWEFVSSAATAAALCTAHCIPLAYHFFPHFVRMNLAATQVVMKCD